jgi:large repetitive protein
MRVRGGVVIAIAMLVLGLVLTGPAVAKKPKGPVPAVAGPDLQLTKTGPGTGVAGTNLTYTLTVHNAGPGAASTVELKDSTPPNTTFQSLAPVAGWACATPAVDATGLIDCTNPSVADGSTHTFTLVLKALANTPDGTVITNSAAVTQAGTDPNPNNDTAATNTTISTVADLVLTKSGPASPIAGLDAVYTVTVTNNGPSDAQDVTVTDTLPSQMSFVSASGGGYSCSQAAGVVTCTESTVANGASGVITITAHEPASSPSGQTRTNSVQVGSSTTDPNSGNNSGASTGTTATLADLSITKTVDNATPPDGTEVTYTVTVHNIGPSDSQSVHWDDTLPSGVTFVSVTQTSGPSFSCNSSSPITCSKATLAAGATAVFSVVAEVDQHAPLVLTANTATVTGTTSLPDPDPSNNTATANITPTAASADLAINKTQSTATPVAGTDFTYTISLTNNGPSDSEAAAWTDTIPAGTTFVSRTATNVPAQAFTCSGTTTTSCSDASLFEEGLTATWDIVVHVTPSVADGTVLTNVATSSETTADPTSGNNSSTATATVDADADVSVTKTGPSSVVAGSNITYTITVTNNGPSDAQAVSLTDAVPAGTTRVSFVQNTGPAFSCSGTTTETCTIATLAAGASATFTFVVSAIVDPLAISPPVTNTANVTSTTDDPHPGNNSDQKTTNVIPNADLSVTKTGPKKVHMGSSAVYTITVHNNGPSATDATMDDKLPAGVHFGSVVQTSGPSFSCSAPPAGTASGKVHCTRGTFASGATAVFQVTFIVHLKLTNTATVSTSGSDSVPGNDSASQTTKLKG